MDVEAAEDLVVAIRHEDHEGHERVELGEQEGHLRVNTGRMPTMTATNACPSNRSPDNAMNKSPARACRESVFTRENLAVGEPFKSSPPHADTANSKSLFSTIHFNAKVAVTTAVMVLSSEDVSFIPSQLVCPL